MNSVWTELGKPGSPEHPLDEAVGLPTARGLDEPVIAVLWARPKTGVPAARRHAPPQATCRLFEKYRAHALALRIV